MPWTDNGDPWTLVASERHGYGWGYLSGEAGQRAEQAFSTFALVVDQEYRLTRA